MLLMILIISVVPFVRSAVFVKDVTAQLQNTRERLILYSKIKPRSHFVGEYDVTPYSFEKECMSIYRTNDWLFANCELPAHCSTPLVSKINKNWLGQEIVLCHGVHPVVDTPRLEFFTVDFIPQTFSFGRPISFEFGKVSNFTNFQPVSFFEWFYVVRGPDGYGIVPKFCSETFRNSTALPPNVEIHSDGDSLCLRRVLFDKNDCRPTFYESFTGLLFKYNFPVQFDGAPFSQGAYASTNNKVIGADHYTTSNSGKLPTHIIDKVGRSYMVTYSSYEDPEPIYIVKATQVVPFEDSECFPIVSKYQSPIEHILKKISNFFRDEIEYLLEFFLVVAEKIASILVAIIGELLSLITTLIPYGELFYTSFFLACVTYVFTRDVLLSVFPTVSIYLLRIYLKTVIN
ncbi:hypothetical protein [Ying Kou virus]|uniref:Putative virion glycoprotein N-terminal domain-containing protein n=1 Tax=Ying Kou virus TaxID=2479372 RepID=A0A3G1Z1N2_9VIRU|nr:hypothetical protein [Ying Kou virus]AYL60136.1 hypothetical protein [Ying Kou virus]